MEKALLIVSFGTSCPEVLERDIVPVERAIQEALPEYVPLRAFGSGMIARKLRQRDGIGHSHGGRGPGGAARSGSPGAAGAAHLSAPWPGV